MEKDTPDLIDVLLARGVDRFYLFKDEHKIYDKNARCLGYQNELEEWVLYPKPMGPPLDKDKMMISKAISERIGNSYIEFIITDSGDITLFCVMHSPHLRSDKASG